MAWFSGKVSLGNFPDLAGAVNKISESVKNIEKNFDSALGFEEKSDSGTSEGTSDKISILSYVFPGPSLCSYFLGVNNNGLDYDSKWRLLAQLLEAAKSYAVWG